MNPQEYLSQHPELKAYLDLVKMRDSRSLSEILDDAIGHYERFKETDNQGEKYAYIFEMLALRERVSVARTEYEEVEKIELAEAVLEIFEETEHIPVESYSRKHLEYLRCVMSLLDKPVVGRSDMVECKYDILGIRARKNGTKI